MLKITRFYPLVRDDEKGVLEASVTINLTKLKINILGILAKKKGDTFSIRMPDKCTIDENGKKSFFPVFSFEFKNDRDKFMAEVRLKTKEFMIDWINRVERVANLPLVELKEDTEANTQAKTKRQLKKKIEGKLLNQLPDVVNKEYVDLKPLANSRYKAKKNNSLKKRKAIVA